MPRSTCRDGWCLQALQLESGQNTELRDDLTALSAELHRLQTLETEREQAQSQPQPAEPSPAEPAVSATEAPAATEAAEAAVSTPGGLAASEEEVHRLRLVCSCSSCQNASVLWKPGI